MLNQVQLIGNLGKDPEVKYGQSGKPYCNLSLATSRYSGKDKEGKTQYETDWHDITVFGGTAEYAGKSLQKGDQVFVQGPYVKEKYTTTAGEEKISAKVLCDKLVKLTRSTGHQSAATAGSSGPGATATTSAAPTIADEDIPF